jgi:hypothetical protein
MIKPKTKTGFTIIELMLAMSFLAVLLVVIAILVIRIVGIYQKGLSIRAVNSTGRAIIDDITRTIGGSPIVNVNPFDPPDSEASRLTKTYFFTNTANIDGTTQTTGGAFCTGSFTYIFNTAAALKEPDRPHTITYNYKNSGGTQISTNDFRLIKVPDSGRQICAQHLTPRPPENADKTCFNHALPNYDTINRVYIGTPDNSVNNLDAPIATCNTAPLELLDQSEDNLALYDFRIFPAASNHSTGHSFYSATFILATLQGGVDIYSSGDYCKDVPDGLNTDFSYCAINKFNFAMRATGETDDQNQYGDL